MRKPLLAVAGLVAAFGLTACGSSIEPGTSSSSLVQPKTWVKLPTSPFASSLGIAGWQIGVEHGVGLRAIGLDQQGKAVTSFEVVGTEAATALYVVNEPFNAEIPVTSLSVDDPAYPYLRALRTSEEVFTRQLQSNQSNVEYVSWGYLACATDCFAAGAEAGLDPFADAAWTFCLLEYA